MSTRTRQTLSLAMILGAVVFGMVIAGGLGLTPDSLAQDDGPIVPEGNTTVTLPSFANLAEAVDPAVVSVTSSSIQERRQGATDPFEFFFGPRQRQGQPGPQGPQGPDAQPDNFRSESGGTGFVISADGLVVTNNHVIRDADSVSVGINGRPYDAEVIGTDAATDLALLRVDVGQPLEYLALGDSDRVRPGDWVMAVGDPFALENSVTIGVVSAKGRQINISTESSSFENFIQTDAAINFGNSGGPLLNLNGEVIGINTAINYGAENIGFAVPVNVLKSILPQLRDEGRVRRGYLGVSIRDVEYDAAEAFGLDEARGALVMDVLPGQPAARAGLENGDIILEMDGRRVDDTRGLIDYISAQGPGETVELEILRDGEMRQVEVELVERDLDQTAAAEPAESESSGIDWMGVRYQDLTPGLRQMHGIPEDVDGVWITSVDATSPLWDEGVRNPEQVIHIVTEVNSRQVESVEEFEALVEAARPGSRLRLFVERYVQGESAGSIFAFPRVPRE